MGAAQSSAAQSAKLVEPTCHGVHRCSFPMYVVKVQDFLAMEGVPEPHQVLRQKGLLQEWQPGMFVIFVSHQWLGSTSPDPSGQQMAVLRQALRAFIDGSMKVEMDLMRTFGNDREGTSYEQVADGYLFFDWFAIPQVTQRIDGVNDDATRSDTARAVQSIPAYVESCDMFVALVPDLIHSGTGLQCNYGTWLARGWCRAELWCRLLSNRPDTSVVVIFSAKETIYSIPLDWQRNLISDGLFTVESDRAEVVKLGEVALRSKVEYLQEFGPLTDYRFHLAQQPRLLNQTKKVWGLDGFLERFKFRDLEAAVKHESGMTGMLCAILEGDADIVQALVEHAGDVNARVSGLGHLGFSDGLTLVMVAAFSIPEPTMLSALLSLHGDPNLSCISETGSIITAAWVVSHPQQVQVLLEKRADLSTSPPLIGAVGYASAATVRGFLEIRCDPNQVAPNGFGPMFGVSFFGRGNPDASETLKLLLAWRGDVNAQADVRGLLYWDCLQARVCAALHGLDACGGYRRQMASLPGATPLSIAAVTGDQALVKILLENDAEHVANERGDLPEDLARAAGHTELLPMLSTFSV